MSSRHSQAGSPSPADSSSPLQPERQISWTVKIFASGLFTGYSPIASGTVASALATAIYFIPGFEHPFSIIPASFLTFILGAKAAEIMEERFGHDPAEVTIDEVLGMWISLMFLPKSVGIAILAFLVFRALDIVKPWPARKFDSIPGGLGIMLDDVVAGFYTNLLMHLAIRLDLPTLLPF